MKDDERDREGDCGRGRAVSARITREALRAAGACHDDEQIAEWVPEDGVEVSEASVRSALAYGVDIGDIHWALCYASGASARILREHACWCARNALALIPSPDPRSVAAVDVAERYARGDATDGELSAARAAARAAACNAAWAAAWAAACNAAWAAAWAAACNAAWAAAMGARAAAWTAQVLDLARRIAEGGGR